MDTLFWPTQDYRWLILIFAAALTAGLGGAFLYWLITTVWGWLTAEPLTFHTDDARVDDEAIWRATSPHAPRASGLATERKHLARVTRLGDRR